MNKVLICNSQLNEIGAIQTVLKSKYTMCSMTSWNGQSLNFDGIDAIILDVNFTEAQGLDFLMEVCSNTYIPVLLVTQPDDPQCAVEARRIGAFNYCVKTDKLHSVLGMAVQEMIFSFSDQQELKRTIMAQKARIAELEAQLEASTGNESTQSNGKALTASQQKRASLLQEIANRLNSGEINLPTFPSMSIELDRLVQKDAGMDEIAELLKKDMTISAKLINVANSSRYGGLRHSSTVEQAISVLGLFTSKEYVDIIANRALYAIGNQGYYNFLKDLWIHGVACAHASFQIATMAKLSKPSEVFFMGLMHDIGKLFLLQVISELQTRDLIDPDISEDFLTDFLQQHHGIFGRKLLEVWKLPSEYALVAQFHETIDQAPTVSLELYAVCLANLLAKRAGYGAYTKQQDDDSYLESITKSIGLDIDSINTIQKELNVFMEETGLSFD